VDGDRPRLLSKRSEFAYTDQPGLALPGEPEAVSEEEQARFSSAARRRQEEQRREAWRRAHDGIDGALEQFEREAHPDKRTASDTRAIRRTAKRIDQRLGLPASRATKPPSEEN
jgi:hypothetical protein